MLPRLSPHCIDMIAWKAITDLVAASYCGADTRRIIELSSGAHLLYLWLGAGAAYSSICRYGVH